MLWANAESREAEAVARLDAVRADGWLGQRVSMLERSYVGLVQIEVGRAEGRICHGSF